MFEFSEPDEKENLTTFITNIFSPTFTIITEVNEKIKIKRSF